MPGVSDNMEQAFYGRITTKLRTENALIVFADNIWKIPDINRTFKGAVIIS